MASCWLPPASMTPAPVAALSNTRTAPVGESMPVVSGGSEVVIAIQAPLRHAPISIDQIATGMPALKSPWNMSAPNDTILAINTTADTKPATESWATSRASANIRSWRFAADTPASMPIALTLWQRTGANRSSIGRLLEYLGEISSNRQSSTFWRKRGDYGHSAADFFSRTEGFLPSLGTK